MSDRKTRSGGTSSIQRCFVVATNYSCEAFLSMLRTAWGLDGESAKNDPDVISRLKNIQIACEKGGKFPLYKTYLPVPKLLYLRKRYMLEDEEFPFLKLEKPLSEKGDLGPWDFLESQLGVGAREGLQFYLDMLRLIKKNSKVDIKFPRRIMEIYLRIHAICRGPAHQGNVRDIFERESLLYSKWMWVKPSNCIMHRDTTQLYGFHSALPDSGIWEATDAEMTELKNLFSNTLKIADEISWSDLIKSLDGYRSSGLALCGPAELSWHYKALCKLIPHLSYEDNESIRKHFKTKACIGIRVDKKAVWYMPSQCIWAPGVKVPDKVDLSDRYEDLGHFFVDFLEVPKFTLGILFKELTAVDPTKTSVEKVKAMIWLLNSAIPQYGHLLDPKMLLSTCAFPVRHPNGHVSLCSADRNFFIADRNALIGRGFGDKLAILHFSPYEVWLLKPFMVWAKIENRYLSSNVKETSHVNGGNCGILAHGLSEAKSYGLLRIASHFHSPKVRGPEDRKAFVSRLEQTQFFQCDGVFRRLEIDLGNSESVIEEIHTDVHLEEFIDHLKIYMPFDEDARDLCFVSRLPRCIVAWMMANLTTESEDKWLVSLVKSVIAIKDPLVHTFLDGEEIGSLNDLNQEIMTSQQIIGPGVSNMNT